ncbi:IQ motif and SEC7 domain-containing protein 2-like isoform X2 [Panonychus citri]|uniref:IQ motif and SEC7 domain-containing protein 2-like isoform X2 n=1 Tax=Panonychus citri TaxID=50023 RepID=UPI0023076407|nr:IQ motif and SEC7 domain-containing protein 2-like isoform X2 [Panonychus citri]
MSQDCDCKTSYQQFIKKQFLRIEDLENQISLLRVERDSLLHENERIMFNFQMLSLKNKSHKSSRQLPVDVTTAASSIHHGSTTNGGERKPETYELSQEIMDKRLEIIVRKYGKGSFKAASVIQKAFRNYQLNKRFKNLALNALRVNNQEKDLQKQQQLRQQQQQQQQQQQHSLTVTGGGSATSLGGLIVNDFVDGESSQSFEPLHQNLKSSFKQSESKLTRTSSSSSAPKGTFNHHHLNQQQTHQVHQQQQQHQNQNQNQNHQQQQHQHQQQQQNQQQQHLYHHHPNFHPNGFSNSFNNNIIATSGGGGGAGSTGNSGRVVVKNKISANTNHLSQGHQQLSSQHNAHPQPSQPLPQQHQYQQQQQQNSVHVHHGGSMKTSVSATSFPHRTPHYDVIRAREYRVGLNLFNKNPPERGIQYLFDKGFIDDIVDESKLVHYSGNLDCGRKAVRVATFLLTKKGLSKQMIGEYLGDLQSPFNQLVLKFFVREMDFTGMLLDVGLRKFQTFFRFPGEAQKIERLVETFAERYCECNEGLELDRGGDSEETPIITNKDDVFILSFAIIMLNTDLHVPNNKRRMTVDQWIKNLRGVVKSNLTEDFLIGIYERIKQAEMKTGHDHCLQVLKVQASLVASSRNVTVPNLSANTYRRLICFCRLHEIVDLNKKERQGQHQREVFLFNDLLLVTKVYKKGGGSAPRTTNIAAAAAASVASNHLGNGSVASQLYSYRRSILLTSVNVSLFSTHYYPYGIKISSRVDKDKTMILFNARNDTDRFKFFEDLKESIAEMHQMEMIRIQSTMGNSNGCSGTTSPSSGSGGSAKRLTVNSVGTVSSSSLSTAGNSNTLKATCSTGSSGSSSSSSSSSSSTVTTNTTTINSSSTGNLPSLNHSSLMDLTTSSNSSSPSSSYSSPKSGLSSSGKHQGINKVSVSTSSLDSALPNSSSSSKSSHHLPPLPTQPSSSQSTSSSSLSVTPVTTTNVGSVGVGSNPMTSSLLTTLTTTPQSLVSTTSLSSSSSSSSSSNQQLTSTQQPQQQHPNTTTTTTHYV